MMYLFYSQTLIILAVFPFAKGVKVNGNECRECIESAGSEGRCFYMPPHNLTWEDAQSTCSSIYGISFLAKDDSEAHNALLTVMMDNGVHMAWIGGKVKGLYWNWTPSKFDNGRKRARPLYGQGCYVGAPSVENSTVMSVDDCNAQCRNQNRTYFMLGQKVDSLFKCQCSDTVDGSGSTECKDCYDPVQKDHLCAENNTAATAIYRVDQQPDHTASDCQSLNRWRLGNNWHPAGVNEEQGCMAYNLGSKCRRFGASKCFSDTNRKPVVCASSTVLSNTGCPSGFNKSGSYCYSTERYTWGDAIKACQPNAEMVAVYNDSIQDDLDTLLNETNEFQVGIWIRGTSRRWLWHKVVDAAGTTELEDVEPPTDDTLEPLPLDGSCLVMKLVNNGTWDSRKCVEEKMRFLCETTRCSSLQTSSSPLQSEPVTTNEAVPVESSPPLPLIIGLTLGICVLVLLLVIMGYFIIARRKLQGKANASNGSVKNLKTRNGQVRRERVNNNYQKSSMKNTYKSDGHKKQRKEKKAKKGTVLHHLLFIKAAARKHKEIHTERVSCETHKGIIEEQFRDYETVQYDQIYAIPQKKSKPKPGSTKNTEEEDIYQLAEPVRQAINQTFSDNQRIPVKDLILLFNDHIKTLKTKEEKAISDLAVAVLPRGDETEMVPNDIYNLIPEDLSRSLKATHAQQAEIFMQQVETDYVLDDLQMMENDIYVAVEDIYAIPVRKNKEKYSETKATRCDPSDVAPTDHIREVVETNFGLQQKLSVKELIDMFENHKTKLQEKRQEALLDIADTFVEQATHMEENVLYGESPWMAEAGNTIQEEYEIFDLQDNPIYQSREDASSEEEKYEDVSYFELNQTADDSVGGRDQIDAVVDNLRKMKPDSAVSFSDTILHNDSIRKRVQDKFGDMNRIPVKSLIALFNEQNMDFNQICSQEMIEIPTQESVPTEQSGGFDDENEYAEINDV